MRASNLIEFWGFSWVKSSNIASATSPEDIGEFSSRQSDAIGGV